MKSTGAEAGRAHRAYRDSKSTKIAVSSGEGDAMPSLCRSVLTHSPTGAEAHRGSKHSEGPLSKMMTWVDIGGWPHEHLQYIIWRKTTSKYAEGRGLQTNSHHLPSTRGRKTTSKYAEGQVSKHDAISHHLPLPSTWGRKTTSKHVDSRGLQACELTSSFISPERPARRILRVAASKPVDIILSAGTERPLRSTLRVAVAKPLE